MQRITTMLLRHTQHSCEVRPHQQRFHIWHSSPIWTLASRAGAGKTSLMALIIAFLVKNGVERIDVINTKRVGYSWCQTLPGVFVHNTITAQMEAIHNIRIKMESRYEEIGQDESRIFPRNVLIIEEQNSWIKYAAQYWADQRQEMDNQERSKTPRQNPAINDIGFILFMGRQACFNVISIFQRMSASASGGGDMRDQYGAKLLARFSPQAFKILVGTSPIPRSSRINGAQYSYWAMKFTRYNSPTLIKMKRSNTRYPV